MTEEQMKKITLFQLTSDIFFGKVLEDPLACEEVINIITGKKFKIKNVKSQYSIRQLASHSVILDIIAVETKNARIHMEMHPQNNEDHMRRIRYNTACVDVECLEKSEDYQNLADVYGIYISKKNFGRKGKGINRIKRVFDSTEKEITDNIEQEASNGSYEYYVNLKGIGDTWEQTELIKYIANADGIIQHVAFPNLVKRVRFLKEEQEGVEIMCEILE
ncbi:MAG: PD-(D/E)XK nuclease family transposase, partial [Eubacteriales bacterium]